MKRVYIMDISNRLISNSFSPYIIAEMSANETNLYVLDLHPIFQKDWNINRKKFNFEYDFHWNEYGHRLAADALHELVIKMGY